MEENKTVSQRKTTFDLASFRKISDSMIATNDNAYGFKWTDRLQRERVRDYTKEDIERIVESGSLAAQKQLSRNYFNKDGFYKRIIIYYATLLKYTGILIPNPSFGKSLSTPFIQKKYYNALDFVERMKVAINCENWALKALLEGSYFGVIIDNDKYNFSILDLPGSYCVSNFKDADGNDLIEFNVAYFDTIFMEEDRNAALNAYPAFISNYYRHWKKGEEENKWLIIPAEIGICFQLYDGRPFFLNVIPATIDYDTAVETDQERDLEEIKKIIVQKIPHLNDGGLLFEPEEAEEIHRGTVGMMKSNKNVSVLTTYADVDSIISRTTAEASTSILDKMVNNIYYQTGASKQIFASDSNLSIEVSIANDMALMMHLAHKFSNFITTIINNRFANTNVTFKYEILPINYYNDKEYADISFKQATSGYSFLLPALALGISQRDLGNLKDLEIELLKLDERLVPLMSAFTQSAGESGPGAPTKKASEKAPKTEKNEKSLDKGGSK